jgi:hypothetical protein
MAPVTKPMPYPEDRRAPQEQGWHLDKKVPISIILTLVGLAITGFMGFSDLKKDVELLKANAVMLQRTDDRLAVELKESMSMIRAEIGALNAKMDRLIEKSIRQVERK